MWQLCLLKAVTLFTFRNCLMLLSTNEDENGRVFFSLVFLQERLSVMAIVYHKFSGIITGTRFWAGSKTVSNGVYFS